MKNFLETKWHRFASEKWSKYSTDLKLHHKRFVCDRFMVVKTNNIQHKSTLTSSGVDTTVKYIHRLGCNNQKYFHSDLHI